MFQTRLPQWLCFKWLHSAPFLTQKEPPLRGASTPKGTREGEGCHLEPSRGNRTPSFAAGPWITCARRDRHMKGAMLPRLRARWYVVMSRASIPALIRSLHHGSHYFVTLFTMQQTSERSDTPLGSFLHWIFSIFTHTSMEMIRLLCSAKQSLSLFESVLNDWLYEHKTTCFRLTYSS